MQSRNALLWSARVDGGCPRIPLDTLLIFGDFIEIENNIHSQFQ